MPSMIAAGAVCAAMAGFHHDVPTARQEMLEYMHKITKIEQVCWEFFILNGSIWCNISIDLFKLLYSIMTVPTKKPLA